MNQDDLLNAVAIVSFLVGLANYQENLTQNDKDDIMNTLDRQTKDILTKLQEEIEQQNEMLREILKRLEK